MQPHDHQRQGTRRTGPSVPAPFQDPAKPPRVDLIRALDEGPFLQRFELGARGMAHDLGLHLVVANAAGDPARQVEMIRSARRAGCAAMIVDHGPSELLAPAIKEALSAGIAVVTFDVVFRGPGVPEVEQEDMVLVFRLARQLVSDFEGAANVVYLNAGGYAPLEKRDRAWQAFKWRHRGLTEVASLGKVSDHTREDTERALVQLLPRHPEANVVLAMWDEFAKGAVDAVERLGLSDRIRVYSVDITDDDITMMLRPNSPWVATVANDARKLGRLTVRAAAAAVAGEAVPKYLFVEPVLVTRDFLVQRKIHTTDSLIEHVPRLADSHQLWFDWMNTVLARRGVEIPESFLPTEDLLHRLQTERAMLKHSNAELAAANRELERFAYSVSHDLRGPLRSIASFAQILSEEQSARLDDDGRSLLHRIVRAALRMRDLIDGMLLMARLAQDEMRHEVVDLSSMALDIVSTFVGTELPRRLLFDVEPDMSAIGDPRLLRAALENLLGNALKFTAREDAAEIHFGRSEAADDGAEEVFFVRDNGIGFDIDDPGRLFEIFNRQHADADFPGTGIGLAVVQQVVERHGGRVWAESEPGDGACFFFTLGRR